MRNKSSDSKNNETGGSIVKGKNELKKELLKVTERIARHEMEVSLYGWPPKCGSLLYQPKRPGTGIAKEGKNK